MAAAADSDRQPLLYGWKAVHKWFRDRGIPVSFRTLRDKWGKRDGFPVSRPEITRDVVADPDRLEDWVQKTLLQ